MKTIWTTWRTWREGGNLCEKFNAIKVICAIVALVGMLAGTAAGEIMVSSGETYITDPPLTYIPTTSTPNTDNVEGGVTFQSGSTYQYEINRDVRQTGHIVARGSFEDIPITIAEDVMLDVHFNHGEGLRYGDEFLVIAANYGQFDNDAQQRFTLTDALNWRFEQKIESMNRGEFLPAGYYLRWLGFAESLQPFNATPNALRAAEGVDRIDQIGQRLLEEDSYDPTGIAIERAIRGLNSLSDPADMANAFAQFHGEVFASNQLAAAQMQRRFVQLAPTGREYTIQTGVPKVWNHWGVLTGDWGKRSKIGQYSGYELWSTGVAVGVDRAVTNRVLLGAAIGYDYVQQDFDTIRSSSRSESFRTMAYGSWFNGNYHIDGYGGYSKHFHHTKRDIDIMDGGVTQFSKVARSRYDDDMASAGIDFGRTWQWKYASVTPSIGLHYILLNSPNVSETGALGANLRVDRGHYDSLRLPVGVKASSIFIGKKKGAAWLPEIRAAYIRELADDSVRVRTTFDGVHQQEGVRFSAESGNQGRDGLRLGVGLQTLVARWCNFQFDYDYEAFKHTSAHGFRASLGVQW